MNKKIASRLAVLCSALCLLQASPVCAADSDEDGLPDEWETTMV